MKIRTDKNGNFHIPYMGGEVVLRHEGSFVADDGTNVSLDEAIVIVKGAFKTMMPFEAFAAIVAAAYEDKDVKEFLESNGVELKKGLI